MENIEQQGSDFKKDLSCLKIDEQFELLKFSCEEFFPEEAIYNKFILAKENKKPLVIKYGVDPFSMRIKTGDIPPLVLLSKLQRMGHKAVIVIGDFTALIGDPFYPDSPKNLNKKKIEKNLKQLKKQLEYLLDFSRTSIVYNSSWLNNIKFPDLIELMKNVSVTELIANKDFKNKIDSNEELTYASLIYPFIMGLDSIELCPDIEIGKNNQISSFHTCRYMMEVYDLESELLMTTAQIPTEMDFYIDCNPIDVFKKIGKLDKKNVISWYKMLTEVSPKNINQLDTLINNCELDLQYAKEVLAKILVSRIHNKEKSDNAYFEYIKELVKKSSTQDIIMVSGSVGIGEFIAASTDLTLCETCKSIKSGGVKVLSCDGECLVPVTGYDADIKSIDFDKFYIIVSDRLILSIKK